MITILGWDISSSTIGYGLLGIDGYKAKILKYGSIKPPKKDKYSIVKRLDIVSDEVSKICQELNPDLIIIEDLLQYMANKTTANTIITLAVFNRTVALQIYKTTGKEPDFMLPISIRSKIKKFRNLDKVEKEDIPHLLKDYFGQEFFKFKGIKKRGINKGQPIIEVYDEADAIAAAWAYAIQKDLIK